MKDSYEEELSTALQDLNKQVGEIVDIAVTRAVLNGAGVGEAIDELTIREEATTKLIDLMMEARLDEFLNTASMMDIPGAGVTPESAGALLKQRLETRLAQLNTQVKGESE